MKITKADRYAYLTGLSVPVFLFFLNYFNKKTSTLLIFTTGVFIVITLLFAILWVLIYRVSIDKNWPNSSAEWIETATKKDNSFFKKAISWLMIITVDIFGSFWAGFATSLVALLFVFPELR